MSSPAAPSTSPASGPEVTSAPGTRKAGGGRIGAPRPRKVPFWIQGVPFFFSAILFLSAVFAVFAPLPILVAYFRAGRRWAVLGAITNAALVAILGGFPSLALYFVFVTLTALVLPEALVRTRSIEKSAVMAFATMLVALGLGLAAYFHFNPGISPVLELKAEISAALDTLAKSAPEGNQLQSLPPEELAEWKNGILLEMPSAVAVLALVMIWANLLMLLRMNPGHVRDRVLRLSPDFFQRWKTPEYLVWPTLVAGFFLLVEVPYASAVAINLFKFLMAIYALQGLSILSAFFLAWGIRGAWRSVGYGVAILVMMPLLLSLGFFDLWFDFRAKFRQS